MRRTPGPRLPPAGRRSVVRATLFGAGAAVVAGSAVLAVSPSVGAVTGAGPSSALNTAALNGVGLGSTNQALDQASSACQAALAAIKSQPGGRNTGSPGNSSFHVCVNGQVVAYGNSAITYRAPSSSYVSAGEALYAENCSSCHEPGGFGGPQGPPVRGVGPAAVDFWVTTGRMPAATPLEVQADDKPPRLTKLQADQIAAYINSLAPTAPFIPSVRVKGGDLAQGFSLYALNCAACHTITGSGDELGFGTFAPSLHSANATQVAEAIRTGPGNMPVFAGNLTDNQVRDIVAYVVDVIQHPVNRGGAGLGQIGPVAEGFVALLFGVGIFMLVAYWIGDRA